MYRRMALMWASTSGRWYPSISASPSRWMRETAAKSRQLLTVDGEAVQDATVSLPDLERGQSQRSLACAAQAAV